MSAGETTPDGPGCGVCGTAFTGQPVLCCLRCATPHHADCWSFNQGCSIFGCGGAEAEEVLAGAQRASATALCITEQSHPPLRLAPLVEGLVRRLRSRARFLPATVASSLLGTLAAFLACKAVDADPVRKVHFVVALFGAGLGGGALAPYLAPLQLQRPWKVAWASMAVGVCSFLGAMAIGLHSPWIAPVLALSIGGILFFASSVAEAVAGHLTPLGQWLGPRGNLARGLVAWVTLAFGVVVLATIEKGGRLPDLEILRDALAIGLMGVAAAVPAMERGKRDFLEAVGAPARLAASSAPPPGAG